MSEQLCPYCGSEMADSGPPVNDFYCPNQACTGHRDAMFASIRERSAKSSALIEAAPLMLAALKSFLCIDFERFTEHDELLLDSVLADAAAAVATAEPAAIRKGEA